jgi:nucleotide-binding universal stress UspA family protein
MNTLLILTDFSESAFHAALYACELSRQYHSKKLILHHIYQVIVPSPGAGVFAVESNDTLRETFLEALERLKDQLKNFADTDTVFECTADGKDLCTSVNEMGDAHHVDLVVMGITGKSHLEQTLVGSSTIRVADKSRYPVLAVPLQTPIEPVKRIVFACDLQKVTGTTPVERLKKILDELEVPLLVVNVVHGNEKVMPEKAIPADDLFLLLSTYQPSFYSIDDKDTVAAIMEFADSHKASLIIMIPKSHDFWDGLFYPGVIRKLAYHTSIPLLLMHEE